MATLNSAIQALVDNLHGKMTDNDPANRLTAEDQSLVTSAISKLSEHTSWELALVAVAQGQLTDAGQTLTDSVTPVIDTLNTAATDVTTAKDTLVAQTTNLAQLQQVSNEVQAMLDNFTDTSLAEFTSKVAGTPKTVFGVQPIETNGQGLENQRAPTAFAVYDSDGESYVVRPCHHPAGTETEWAKLETLKLRGDGAGKEVIGFHYVHFHTFDASPQTYVYQYGASAILPLAGKNDSEGMNYVRLFSTQTTASSAWADYAGIYVLNAGSNLGSESITKPRRLIGATDQWGIPTSTFHFWNDVGVLYDNMRHCVTMVDDTTGTLIQKYSDGNVDTQIAIADSAALQAYVDAGDFTVVKFINHLLQWPYAFRRSDTTEVAMAVSHESDCHGYYGKLGNTVRMGGSMYCAHYRFTAAKKLEPLNYFFASTVNAAKGVDANGTDSAEGEVNVTIADFNGNTLGSYFFESKADYVGLNAGYLGSAIVCMNPYSHAGILNEYTAFDGSGGAYYGVGRSCKAF